MASEIWPWVKWLFWISIFVSLLDFLAFSASLIYLLFCRQQKNYKIIGVQVIGYGYLVFGAVALINNYTGTDSVVSTTSQSISYSFDNLFHWISCFIYLKAALVLPYLFDNKFYSDNEDI